jgi:hypothetical protein
MLHDGAVLADRPGGRALRIVGAPSVGPDLSLRDKRLQFLKQRGSASRLDVGEVELVYVEVVGGQAAQRRLQRPAQIARRDVRCQQLPCRLVVGVPPLARDDRLVAVTGEGTAKDSFAAAGSIDVRRVKEPYPEVECEPDSFYRLVVIDFSPAERRLVMPEWAPHRPAAHAKGWYRYTGAAECAFFHFRHKTSIARGG